MSTSGTSATSDHEDAKIVAEFNVLVERAGLNVPPERRQDLIAGFKNIRPMLPLLRRPVDLTSEPSSVCSTDTVSGACDA